LYSHPATQIVPNPAYSYARVYPVAGGFNHVITVVVEGDSLIAAIPTPIGGVLTVERVVEEDVLGISPILGDEPVELVVSKGEGLALGIGLLDQIARHIIEIAPQPHIRVGHRGFVAQDLQKFLV
jgi:hypothetical protein